jgi:hypothetical protein
MSNQKPALIDDDEKWKQIRRIAGKSDEILIESIFLDDDSHLKDRVHWSIAHERRKSLFEFTVCHNKSEAVVCAPILRIESIRCIKKNLFECAQLFFDKTGIEVVPPVIPVYPWQSISYLVESINKTYLPEINAIDKFVKNFGFTRVSAIEWEMVDEIHWIIYFEKNFGSGRIYACSKSEINNFSSMRFFTNNKSLIASMDALSLAIGFPNYNAKINDPENGGLLGCIPIPLQD